MIAIINLFLPLFIQVIILYLLSRLLNKVIMKQLGKKWYLVTMWPGVMIHELSHLVGCLLTFTKVYKVNLFTPTGDSLGSVEHAKTGNPMKNIIISIAPLFGGTLVIWLLTSLFFPEIYRVQLDSVNVALSELSSFQNFFNFTVGYFQLYWDYFIQLMQNMNFGAWQTYLFIYLMLSLSSHVAPSKKDLSYTYVGIIGLILLFTLIYFMDQWLEVPITWSIIQWLTKPIYLTANFLIYGIVFTVFSLAIMQFFALIKRIFVRG